MSIAFPLKHVSIRVPWHDSGWNGTICSSPSRNSSCLKLVNIAESKNDEAEERNAGRSIKDLSQSEYPPCVMERATFMADFSFSRSHSHPYSKLDNETHRHFRPTPLYHPAYSAAGLPFRWMNKKFVFGDPKNGQHGFIKNFPLEHVNEQHEPVLDFNSAWLQDHRNHDALLECFWNHIRAEESLVFFYAKQIPLVEEIGRRVIVGVGRVKSVGPSTEYLYEGSPAGKIRSYLWERMVTHSIRPDFVDGFLMPYHEALERAANGATFDLSDVVAFAPDDHFDEFSYATEHVGTDGAISALMACRAALVQVEKSWDYSTSKQQQWIDRELGRLWKKRGAFPGLGAVLNATGIPLGNFVAQSLIDRAGENGNPWDEWFQALNDPGSVLPNELARNIDRTIIASWQRMNEERRSFLQTLSRLDLSDEHANVLATPETRRDNGIELSDTAFLENPYLFYEATRLTLSPISIGVVDRGVFPTEFIREKFPLAEPTLIRTSVDARRLRALCIRELEHSADQGDTLRSREDIIISLRKGDEERKEDPTLVTNDLLGVAEDEQFEGQIRIVSLKNEAPAYQIERLANVGELIRKTVERRSQSARHKLDIDWQKELDAHLKALPDDEVDRVKEVRARQEKAAALEEIASSRVSVLIGPAGTGKTTLLSVLCSRPEISDDGILLLAPTGKARVRMESVARTADIQNYQALTLAQFLNRSKPPRYDGRTGRYLLTGTEGQKVGRTVIVDECSMLTEEMMAALLEAISGVHRLIFVGDPRQLPPIGAGRPFVDVVKRLAPSDIEARFPRVGTCYAELTVPRRQGAGDRDDLQLAAWFGGMSMAPGEDQVFEILSGKRTSDNVSFVQWETADELENALFAELSDKLTFQTDREEFQNFAATFGAFLDRNGTAWYNSTWGEKVGSGRLAESWQILSPVRQKAWGVTSINRLVHNRYMAPQLEMAREQVPKWQRRVPQPVGDEQIVYGDKVINNRNWTVSKKRIYPEPEGNGYLANGEIGVVVGHRRSPKMKWDPEYLDIEFSTQAGTKFKFYKSDFDEEGEAKIELAYALTVHKAQGSEFNNVFLVLPKSPNMAWRELLYTALTRQKERVVVLHQGSATDLQRLSSEEFSATAARLTNLFGAPDPIKIGDRFLEQNLIHITSRGDAVRSKSEVIIANLFHAKGVHYLYEEPLIVDGVTKYPDFTIEDDDTGITYYWEHCGMLSDPAYKRRWEEKKVWYRENGILPHDEGGGTKGTLIVSQDEPNGGISSQDITSLIDSVLLGS